MSRIRAAIVFLAVLAAGSLFSLLGTTGRLQSLAEGFERAVMSFRHDERAGMVLLLDEGATGASLGDASIAEAILRMTEFSSRGIVLDIPAAWASMHRPHAAISRKALGAAFDLEFSKIGGNIEELFTGLKRGSIRTDEASDYVTKLLGLVGESKLRLLEEATSRDEESEAALGRAVRLSGGVYLPFDLGPKGSEGPRSDASRFALRGRAAAKPALAEQLLPTAAALPLFEAAAGAGYVGAAEAKSGSRLRIAPIVSSDKAFYSEIGFAATLRLLGNPAIALGERTIGLKKARLPGSSVADIEVPLDAQGRLLMDLPANAALSGFRRLPWSVFEKHARLEASLVAAVRDMERSSWLAERGELSTMVDLYDFASGIQDEMLAQGRTERLDEWKRDRQKFFRLAEALLTGGTEDAVAASSLRELQDRDLPGFERAKLRASLSALRGKFAETRRIGAEILALREAMKAGITDSLCVVAPVEAEALASCMLIDTILSQRFRSELPASLAFGLGALCALAVAAAALARRIGAAVLVAALAFLLSLGSSALLALSAGMYLNPVAPAGAALVALAAATAARPRSRASRSGS